MGEQTGCDWRAVVAELNGLLKLKTTITAMKLFERVEDMEAVPRIRRPQAVHTTDQVVAMAARLGWTVGITADDLVGPQCRAVIGLSPQDEAFKAGREFVGVWHATPGQMILFINGLQWRGYRRFDWSVVGETACADSWGRALATGEPSLSPPCYAERRFGGVPDDEMLMALPPRYLPVAIEGLKALAKNGIRYPVAPYGIQNDVRAGLVATYDLKR